MCSTPKNHRRPFSSWHPNKEDELTFSVDAMKRFTETANRVQEQKAQRQKKPEENQD